jgi:hypothetical protein
VSEGRGSWENLMGRCDTFSKNDYFPFFFHWFFQPIRGPGLLFSSVIIFTDGRTPWTSDQPVARPLSKHRTTQTQNKSMHILNIHALSGIRTHDPSVRGEDSSCLRQLGYGDWRLFSLVAEKIRVLVTIDGVRIGK